MGKIVTAGQLDLKFQTRADMINRTNALPTAERYQYLEDATQEYWDLVLLAFGDDYFSKAMSPAITTVAGTSKYSLPSDFYRLLWVDFTANGQTWSLSKFMRAERNYYKSRPWASTTGYPCQYRLLGSLADGSNDQIEFLPTPSGAYTIDIRYVMAPPIPNSATPNAAFLSVLPGGDVYIVERACAKFYEREERDASAFQQEAALAAERIKACAPSRDLAPERVTEVEYLAYPDDLGLPGGYW